MRHNFYNNNRVYEFKANVTSSCKSDDGHFLIELDGTYFYPEGGGQPADKGTINGVNVIDVQKDGHRVIHYLEKDIEQGEVSCIVNKEHRDHYMVQHTGQHLISAVLKKELDIDTISVHLGENKTTIEIDRADISENEINVLEDVVNSLIATDKRVIYHETDDQGLQNFNIRRSSKYSGYIRVVEIENYDNVPCGGVHLSNLYEIGLIKVVGYEKIRGHIRLIFLIGKDAFLDYRNKNKIITDLNTHLSTSTDTIIAGVESLKKNIYDLKLEKKSLINSYSKLLVDNIIKETPHYIKFKDCPTSFTKHFVVELQAVINKPLLIVNITDRLNWYLLDSKASSLDFKHFKESILTIVNGKGGGKKGLWQGSGEAKNFEIFISSFSEYLDNLN